MDFFRAVSKHSFIKNKQYRRQETRRLPSNIPYFVDNLWEWLRPEGSPSRRHSIYASPTPELALANASAGYLKQDEYVVCKLTFSTEPLTHQLRVPDAREHVDIKAFQKCLASVVGPDFGSLALADKMALAPLFVPGVAEHELSAAAGRSRTLSMILSEVHAVSTFWESAGHIDATSKGELFFELQSDNTYMLSPL